MRPAEEAEDLDLVAHRARAWSPIAAELQVKAEVVVDHKQEAPQ